MWKSLIELLTSLFGEIVKQLLGKPIKEERTFKDVGKAEKPGAGSDKPFTDGDW